MCQMSVKLVILYLIFSYIINTMHSVEICCTSQSILYSIRKSNSISFQCFANNTEPEKYNPDKVLELGTVDSVEGYGLNINKDRSHVMLSNCTEVSFSNISLVTETSINVPSNACLLKVDNHLIVIKCKSETDDKILKIGIVNKCCPAGYVYVSEVSKCFSRKPNFNIYSSIFKNPMIFVDNTFTCPKSKASVEYVIPAEQIELTKKLLILKDKKRSFKKSEFCIEAIDDNKLIESTVLNIKNQTFFIRTCQQIQICDSIPCVRKCCADNEIYYKKNMTTLCRGDESEFAFQSFSTINFSGNVTKSAEYGVIYGLDCPKFRLDPEIFADESHVISGNNGSLIIESTQKSYSRNQYCIERIENLTYLNQKFYTFVCFDSKVVNNDRIRFKMYPIGLLISCCFYAITLLVYTSIEKLRNLPGKILICLVSSLFLAYLGIALGQLLPTPNNDICFVSGFVVYFFLMAAFSWMNITCFDIWKTFGSTKSTNLQRKEQRTRFLCYSIYGWGMPTILTVIAVTLSRTDVLKESLRPKFGHGRCWFTYDTIGFASLLFFSGPIGLLFIVNLVLFLLTLKYCNKVKREIFRMQSSNSQKLTLKTRFFIDKTRFIMNTKLGFVMGITWLLEIASILFYDHKNNFFWSISDSFNVLLGVFVFIIFVFKRRVWMEVMIKLGFQSRPESRRNGNATGLTQSTCVHSSTTRKLDVASGNIPLVRKASSKV